MKSITLTFETDKDASEVFDKLTEKEQIVIEGDTKVKRIKLFNIIKSELKLNYHKGNVEDKGRLRL